VARNAKHWRKHRTSIAFAGIQPVKAKLTRTANAIARQRRIMKMFKTKPGFALAIMITALAGCSNGPAKSPDVADAIRKNLDQATLGDVSVSQDRDKGVVTLGGHVGSESLKSQAESIAKSIAGSQVVADQIAVTPPGVESEAKTINADLDKGIDKNLDAALIQVSLNKSVKYDVKNGVVTLKGNVNSETKRVKAEAVASHIPNVQQVVNELEVQDRKATSTN
jgi:hyperosmotically inducible periplasmic protein